MAALPLEEQRAKRAGYKKEDPMALGKNPFRRGKATSS